MKIKLTLALAAAAMATSLVTAPAAQAQEPMIGEIRLFGSNFCPRGWAEAAGQMLSISQNTALFSLYGTMYGGDGRSTFALPDMRGRTPVDALGQAATRTTNARYTSMRYCVALQGIFPSRN
jgi:microcystin-dependent protein